MMRQGNLAVALAFGLISVSALAGGFATGFEVTEKPAVISGDELHLTGGEPYRWNWSGDDIGTISARPAAVRSGSQGLDATRRTTGHAQAWWTRPGAFPPASSGRVSISLSVRAVDWQDHPDSVIEIAASDTGVDDLGANPTRSAWVSLKGNGRLYAWSGNAEMELAADIPVGEWQALRIEIDVPAGAYRVLLNGREVARDLAFFNAAVHAVRSIQFKEYNSGKSVGGVYLDDITARVEP